MVQATTATNTGADQTLKIAIFASGQGRNFQAIVDAAYTGTLGNVVIDLLVSDKPQAPVVQRAVDHQVDTYLFTPRDYARREDYETAILTELQARGIGLIVLAGYMRILSHVLVNPYAGRIINIHPSLLPAFTGKDAIGQALAYGVKLAGVTVHFVDLGMDTGPIIAQRAVTVLPDDSHQTLTARIQAVEWVLYPEVIALIAAGRVTLQSNKYVTVQA
jgi:phosphoribosylglycinamide formyltransferase-1